MTSMLEKALSLIDNLQLPIFPCMEVVDDKGKISKRPYTKNGFKDATFNKTQIREWWKQYPNAII